MDDSRFRLGILDMKELKVDHKPNHFIEKEHRERDRPPGQQEYWPGVGKVQ